MSGQDDLVSIHVSTRAFAWQILAIVIGLVAIFGIGLWAGYAIFKAFSGPVAIAPAFSLAWRA